MPNENKEAAIAAIRTCKTLDSLNKVLKRFDLVDSQEIIDCLIECMYSPETFRCPGGDTSVEEDLEMAKQIFLVGTWRISELHERMGMSAKAMGGQQCQSLVSKSHLLLLLKFPASSKYPKIE